MILVVLPAYNEEEAIRALIDSILLIGEKRFIEPVRVIVVDDGSTDGTVEQVQSYPSPQVTVVRHEKNSGLGEALKTGLLAALEQAGDEDVIITMDADNTHSPGLLLRMVMLIEEGCDVVTASRYQRGARVVGVNRFRRFLSFAMSLGFSMILPISGARDYSSGFRAYRARTLRAAFDKWGKQFIDQSGFTCMVAVLIKLARLGAIVSEVPMILRYDQKVGPSKMNVIRTIRDTLRLLVMERLGLYR